MRDHWQGCRDYVPAAEHIRHPIQGAHFGPTPRHNMLYREAKLGVRSLRYDNASLYGAKLLVQTRAFALRETVVPESMFHYATTPAVNRSQALLRRISDRLLRRDDGCVCGAVGGCTPLASQRHSRRPATPAEDAAFNAQFRRKFPSPATNASVAEHLLPWSLNVSPRGDG